MKTATSNPTKKRPLRRRALHVAAVDSMRELIIEGELAAGARLVEAELCDMFEISRTPLREALRVLEAEGLVTFIPNRGAVVSTISAEEVVEQFEVIANLERIALELTMVRMSSSDLGQLNQMHVRMLHLFEARERRECFQNDYDIHDRIVALAGNRELKNLHRNLMIRSRRVRYFALHSESRWSEAMTEHEQFMQAINDDDVVLATITMRDHVLRTGALVSNFILNNHDDASPVALRRADQK